VRVEVWVRVDRSTRMMRGGRMHCTVEEAHAFAAQQWGGRAYEIDCDGVTVFVSPKAAAVMNGGQYSLFITRSLNNDSRLNGGAGSSPAPMRPTVTTTTTPGG
jgi:hypothetical protein|tara:strand:- start:2546 stop:2854 length:309 start_codon:yes stop_codon:yes gene_type:complete